MSDEKKRDAGIPELDVSPPPPGSRVVVDDRGKRFALPGGVTIYPGGFDPGQRTSIDCVAVRCAQRGNKHVVEATTLASLLVVRPRVGNLVEIAPDEEDT